MSSSQSARGRIATTLLLLEGAIAASCCANTITRDVAVIGGGASGAHAAVWLRDNGNSVVLVEKADHLGGHTYFYEDPATDKVFNIGVQAWMQYEDSYDFPARMNVSTSGSMQFASNDINFIDFESGSPVENYTAPAAADLYPALADFLTVLQDYQEYLLPDYTKFPAGADIPEDLTMSFGALVEKYGIEASVPQMWDATAVGLGDTMDVPAMWVMQASTNPMVEALLGTAAAAVPASGRLWDLYEAVQTFLGSDVLYSTTVTSSKRSSSGVTLTTTSANGTQTCIKAKRLLLAIQPTPENLAPFSPDATELAVFNQYNFSTVYAGILQHPSLQINNTYSDRSTDPGSFNYTVFPQYPQLAGMAYLPGTENLFQFTAVGTEDDTAETMQALIGAAIESMIEAGTLPASNGSVSFPMFHDHGKMHPRLTAEALKANVLQDQVALQGHLSTWYTGAAFSAPFSTVLWEYNKALLPNMTATLNSTAF